MQNIELIVCSQEMIYGGTEQPGSDRGPIPPSPHAARSALFKQSNAIFEFVFGLFGDLC